MKGTSKSRASKHQSDDGGLSGDYEGKYRDADKLRLSFTPIEHIQMKVELPESVTLDQKSIEDVVVSYSKLKSSLEPIDVAKLPNHCSDRKRYIDDLKQKHESNEKKIDKHKLEIAKNLSKIQESIDKIGNFCKVIVSPKA